MRRRVTIIALSACLLLAGCPLDGEVGSAHPNGRPITFQLPIDCVPDQTCWPVNYPDHSPENTGQDFMCGRRAAPTHRGTDFAIRGVAEMKKGVAVLAAADGMVGAVRDGAPDNDPRYRPESAAKRTKCGNGVRIDHASGWHSYYCHLRKDSVVVKIGETVSAGQKIGSVGQSGTADFPHLHFDVEYLQGSTRYAVDPATGLSDPLRCGDTEKHLWSDKAFSSLRYRPFDIANVFIMPFEPDPVSARRGVFAARPPLESKSPVFIAFDTFGTRKDDLFEIAITEPLGVPIVHQEKRIDDNYPEELGGVRTAFPIFKVDPPAHGWQPGMYSVEMRISRTTKTGVISEKISRTFEMPNVK